MKQHRSPLVTPIIANLIVTALEGLVGAVVGLAVVHLTHAAGWHDQGTEVTLMAATFVMLGLVNWRLSPPQSAEEKS